MGQGIDSLSLLLSACTRTDTMLAFVLLACKEEGWLAPMAELKLTIALYLFKSLDRQTNESSQPPNKLVGKVALTAFYRGRKLK